MNIHEEMWKMVKDHLCYTDEEMKIFRADPRNEDVNPISILSARERRNICRR